MSRLSVCQWGKPKAHKSKPCHQQCQAGEHGSAPPGEESREASCSFRTAKGDKMNCTLNVTDFQSGLHSEVFKLPSRMTLSFLNH